MGISKYQFNEPPRFIACDIENTTVTVLFTFPFGATMWSAIDNTFVLINFGINNWDEHM